MSKFQTARTNMVDSQIHTAGIVLPALLEAYETVPREKFVPEALKNVAYNDEDLSLGGGRYLMEPVVHARMVQAVEPGAGHVVLDVGGASGYSAAILSPLVSTVIALEEDADVLAAAQKNWQALDVCNVAGIQGVLTDGATKHAPYDIIFINGAVSEIPENLAQQLSTGGKLIAILKKPDEMMGDVTIVQKLENGQLSSQKLFSAGCPYVPGFEPKTQFSF